MALLINMSRSDSETFRQNDNAWETRVLFCNIRNGAKYEWHGSA